MPHTANASAADSPFSARHIGTTAAEQEAMLHALGFNQRAQFIDSIIPAGIRRSAAMDLLAPCSEAEALDELRALAAQNKIFTSHIGRGYHGCHTPSVILRNILENPAWYTAYTPYQAEISQGRLEAMLNFQTMIMDLTAMPIANASMLDEASAAAEAMMLAQRVGKSSSTLLLVAHDILPQTWEVLQTRARPLGIEIKQVHAQAMAAEIEKTQPFAICLQYPGVHGQIRDLRPLIDAVHSAGGLAIVAADLLALTLLTPPGELGADIAIGSTQRFGMPMGAGGPHAAYMACQDAYKRSLPGRLVGISQDSHGQAALRLALQTREQHIRREKATSNICTAQVLPAVVASMYAVYHGPEGLRNIALRIAGLCAKLASALQEQGWRLLHDSAFDTLHIETGAHTQNLIKQAEANQRNLGPSSADSISITLDETHNADDVDALLAIFAPFSAQAAPQSVVKKTTLVDEDALRIPTALRRTSAYLQHAVFNKHHSETAMLRYIRALSDKDLALDRCMIPLGSCTMKLNASSEMIPITWPEFAHIHPYAPQQQQQGYAELNRQLCRWLSAITGYAGISLEPNAGSQGEFAGLLAIQAYHAAQGQAARNICLIPSSAHGTNPASAAMAGMQVVVTRCDEQGNIDLEDLRAKCAEHGPRLSCIMVTYPSTHGVFEDSIGPLCEIVHAHGGRVYVDGANMNALVGLAAPGAFGGDVSHLNLHKTFCIPHGGGGPGVGPVCVAQDLVPYLPRSGVGAISAAPLGNAAVLPISWMYCRMMGATGLQTATEIAILNANYISHRLAEHYPTLYTDQQGRVAHECILDCRSFKDSSGIMAEDIAKRLIDYGIHAPTLSFPVPNTLMVEPTESEPAAEIERFIAAMIAIRNEIRQIENGSWSQNDNPLKNAPHTAASLLQEKWPHPYSRATAAVLPENGSGHKPYWPPVGRIDNVYGDRNLFCSCETL